MASAPVSAAGLGTAGVATRLAPVRHDTAAPPAGEPIPAGRRHDGLLHIALELVRRGVIAEDLLRGALLEANRCRCQPPGDPAHVAAIAVWAARSGIAEGQRRAAARFEERANWPQGRSREQA